MKLAVSLAEKYNGQCLFFFFFAVIKCFNLVEGGGCAWRFTYVLDMGCAAPAWRPPGGRRLVGEPTN